MADVKLSALDSIPAIDRTADLLYVVDDSAGTSNKVTPNSLLGITGDPIGHTDSQTLSNKTLGNSNILTLRDDRFTLQDSGDTTRQATFQLSGITAGQTRVMTLPDYNGTLATLAGTETLTNKTIPSAVLDQAAISRPTLTIDTIAEYTAGAGITVDGLLIKDGLLPAGNIQPLNLVAGTGATWPWQSWVPTWTNLTVGNGTVVARYRQTGKTVDYMLTLTFGGTTSITGNVSVSIPVTSTTYGSFHTVAGGSANDSGTIVYPINHLLTSTTVGAVFALNASAVYGFVTSTVPFTWATGDILMLSGSYEAA